MKSIYVLVSLFLLQLNSLHAQTADHEIPTWGLQYQIGSDFTLSSFSGTSLSLIKVHSEKNSTRLGITLYGLALSSRGELTGANSMERESDGFNSRVNVSLNALRLRHAELNDKIRPYIGAGLGIPLMYNHSKSTGIRWDSAGNEIQNSTYRSIDYTVGLSTVGIIGFEWFVRKNMSLSSEYQNSIEFGYQNRIQKSDNQSASSRSENSNWSASIPIGSVRTSLSVYF
jgi:hypothetical protein